MAFLGVNAPGSRPAFGRLSNCVRLSACVLEPGGDPPEIQPPGHGDVRGECKRTLFVVARP